MNIKDAKTEPVEAPGLPPPPPTFEPDIYIIRYCFYDCEKKWLPCAVVETSRDAAEKTIMFLKRDGRFVYDVQVIRGEPGAR